MEQKGNPDSAQLAADLRSIVGQMRRRMREQADAGDLVPSQIAALYRLEREGPLTLSALARAEGMRPQSMAPTVSALQASGQIISSPDPNDGRQQLLSLSDQCRDWIEAGRAARQDWLTRVIARDLEPEDRQLLARVLPILKRIAHA